MTGKRGISREQELANAAKLKAELLECIRERGSVSVREICAVLSAKPSTVRDYLFRMANANLVVSILRPGYGGAPVAAIYSLKDGSLPECEDCLTPNRKTLRTYPRNEYKDPFALPEKFFK